jgi:hypothetical protein
MICCLLSIAKPLLLTGSHHLDHCSHHLAHDYLLVVDCSAIAHDHCSHHLAHSYLILVELLSHCSSPCPFQVTGCAATINGRFDENMEILGLPHAVRTKDINLATIDFMTIALITLLIIVV